jgi:hypothetical protein
LRMNERYRSFWIDDHVIVLVDSPIPSPNICSDHYILHLSSTGTVHCATCVSIRNHGMHTQWVSDDKVRLRLCVLYYAWYEQQREGRWTAMAARQVEKYNIQWSSRALMLFLIRARG